MRDTRLPIAHTILRKLLKTHVHTFPAAVAQWVRAFAPQAEGWVFLSQPQQTQAVKQVVKAALSNAR